MSNTLRRPMFRGGPVDSYNTGITSGLDDSRYADGGNVIPKRGLVDGPGGYAGDFNYSRDTGLGRFMPKFNEYAFREPLAAAYNLVGVPLNKATEFVTGYNPGFSGEKRMMNSGKNGTKRSVSETKKKFVASSQNWKCGNCNKQLNHTFEVDHKKRLEYGGTNEVSNLIALCRNCHGEKTAMENM